MNDGVLVRTRVAKIFCSTDRETHFSSMRKIFWTNIFQYIGGNMQKCHFSRMQVKLTYKKCDEKILSCGWKSQSRSVCEVCHEEYGKIWPLQPTCKMSMLPPWLTCSKPCNYNMILQDSSSAWLFVTGRTTMMYSTRPAQKNSPLAVAPTSGASNGCASRGR